MSQCPIFQTQLRGGVMEYYAPFVKETYTNNRGKEVVFERPFIPSLFFMRSSVTQAECLEESLPGKARLYRHQTEKGYCPIAIPLRQMEMFIKATQYADDDLDIFEDDAFWMKKGVRVRVTGGKFEGLEGEIKRIDGDHRLVVTVEGICAVATAYIPKCYLEKIE